MDRSYLFMATAGAFLLGCVVTFAAMKPYKQTLKECVLEQMRGQPDRMVGTAIALCDERHPNLVEKESLN